MKHMIFTLLLIIGCDYGEFGVVYPEVDEQEISPQKCEPYDYTVEYSQENLFDHDGIEFQTLIHYENPEDVRDGSEISGLYQCFLDQWLDSERPVYEKVAKHLSKSYLYFVRDYDTLELLHQSDATHTIAFIFAWGPVCHIKGGEWANFQIVLRHDSNYKDLVHELIHAALMAAYGDPNYSHTDKDYWSRDGNPGNFKDLVVENCL